MRKSADGAVSVLIGLLAIGALLLIAVLAATGMSAPWDLSPPLQDQYGSTASAGVP